MQLNQWNYRGCSTTLPKRDNLQVDQFSQMKRALAEALCLPRCSNDERNTNAKFLCTHATQDNDAPQTHHVAAVEPLGVCTKLCNGLTKLVFLHQRSCSPNWYLLQKTRSVMDRTQSQRDTDETGTCFSRDPTHDRL